MFIKIFLISLFVAIACATCPPGWAEYKNKCFLVAKGSINHPQAQANCTAQGAALASIHNEEENEFVKSLLAELMTQTGTGGFFHIGMMFSRTTPDATGPVTSSVWMDGSPVDYGNPADKGFEPGTSPWSDGKWRGGKPEPNGDGSNGRGTELCVQMPQSQAVNGDWVDASCSSLAGLICNKKAT